MATGSLKVVNESKTITGTGTAFANELGRGDFVVFTVSTITYTLAVNAVEDDKITLAKPYTGPSADDVPFSIVPVGTGSMVTTELVAQITEALRGMNADKKIWQSVFSEEADMTITLPDGQTFTGPSWLHIVNAVKEAGGDELIATVETVREAVANVENNRASVEKTVTDAKADITDTIDTAKEDISGTIAAGKKDISETIATGKEDMQAIADAAAASAEAAAGSEDAAAESLAAATEQAHAASDSAKGAQESATMATSAATTAKNQADRATEEADKLENWNDLAGAIDKVTDKDVVWKGAMKVGREAAADFELVTLRQLISATSTGGAGGPTMNGVMNNSLGCVEWFNGTRAKMWPGYLAADGQCLSRAANPEVWAAIAAGIFNAVDESAWSEGVDANGYSNRASYSKGGEKGTCPDKTITDAWFRLPDLNGGQKNSILNGFLRGSAPNNGNVGRTHQDGAPNITGTLSTVIDGVVFLPTTNGAGALGPTGSPDNVLNNIWSGAAWSSHSSGVSIDASRSYSGYGRSTTEIRPAASIGIWVIRVNGIFKASDSIFNVIDADQTLPDSGAIVYGGAVQSLYQAAGKDQMFARMRAKYNIGNGHKSIVLDIVDNTGDSVKTNLWELRDDGAWSCPNMGNFRNSAGLGEGSVPWFGSMELSAQTPFIDFHYGQTDADYDVRIINDHSGVLSIASPDGNPARVRLAGGYQCRQGIMGGFNNNAFNFYWNEQAQLEAWVDVTNVGLVLLNGRSSGQPLVVENKPNGNPAYESRESNAYTTGDGHRTNMFAAVWNNANQYGTIDLFDTGTDIQMRMVAFNTGQVNAFWVGAAAGSGDSRGGQFAYAASDIVLKNRGDNVVQEEAAARIDKLKPCDFEWKRDGRLDRGFIAQEAHKVDQRYAWEADPYWGLSDRAILADAVATIQMMRQQVADLQAEVKKLKAAK